MAYAMGDLMENPQAEDGEGPPGLRPPWGQDAYYASLHASMTNAAYHIEAKNAMDMMQHWQSLYLTILHLHGKVQELEEWKRKALDDVRKLREEHKLLRKMVMGDDRQDEQPSLQRSKSSPAGDMARPDKSFDPQFVVPAPPGLDLFAPQVASGEQCGDKQGPPKVHFDKAVGPATLLEKCLTRQQANTEVTTNSDQPLGLTRDESGDLQPSLDSCNRLSTGSLLSDFSAPDGESCQLEGVQVVEAKVEGADCVRAEWRIGHLSTKLRSCMGRPLVSSPFKAAGLEDLRLMVSADGKDVAKGPRSRRQKEIYAKKVMEGPLDGCLKLKVPNCPATFELQYYLKVGQVRRGPFLHNFAESTVSGCEDFGIDWLKQLEADQSLTVCVEIFLEAKAASTAVPPPPASPPPSPPAGLALA